MEIDSGGSKAGFRPASRSQSSILARNAVSKLLKAFRHHDCSHAQYKVGRILGQGNYGVTRILTRNGRKFAGNFIPRRQVTVDVERELLNHRPLAHPNIVRFVEVYLTETDLVVVMELASEGELFGLMEKVGALPEHIARMFFRQLIGALEHCHGRHVVHRDLKLENLLLDHSQGNKPLLKICDFGFSKHLINHSTAHSFKGNRDYLAPEVINAGWCQKEGSKYDGTRVDVWSCGVILYIIVTGRYPFEMIGSSSVENNIINGFYLFPDDVDLTDSCLDLISGILEPQTSQRMTLAHIKLHPWFTAHPQDEVVDDKHVENFEPQSEEQVLQILAQARQT